jgi:hypothetical protein
MCSGSVITACRLIHRTGGVLSREDHRTMLGELEAPRLP